jgi:hypothetical protein
VTAILTEIPLSASPNSIADNCASGLGIYSIHGGETMHNQTHTEKPPSTEDSHTVKTGQDKQIDRIADQAAEKAGNAEKRYDQDHDIFTK